MKTARASVTAGAVIAVTGLSYFGLSGAAPILDEAPIAVPLPATVDDFRLTDQNLHSHELRWLGDASAIVLITQENGCPVIRNTATAVKALQESYASKGVEIMLLNSTPTDRREAILTEAKEYGYDLPILMALHTLRAGGHRALEAGALFLQGPAQAGDAQLRDRQ